MRSGTVPDGVAPKRLGVGVVRVPKRPVVGVAAPNAGEETGAGVPNPNNDGVVAAAPNMAACADSEQEETH